MLGKWYGKLDYRLYLVMCIAFSEDFTEKIQRRYHIDYLPTSYFA